MEGGPAALHKVGEIASGRGEMSVLELSVQFIVEALRRALQPLNPESNDPGVLRTTYGDRTVYWHVDLNQPLKPRVTALPTRPCDYQVMLNITKEHNTQVTHSPYRAASLCSALIRVTGCRHGLHIQQLRHPAAFLPHYQRQEAVSRQRRPRLLAA
jgi:hypothetical protein